MRAKLIIGCAGLTLGLAACGGTAVPTNSGTGNGGQTTYTKTGAVLLSRFSSVLGGQTQSLTTGSGVFNAQTFTGAPPTLGNSGIPDSCQLGTAAAPPGPNATSNDAPTLNAGSAITLKSGAQTYATLPKKVDSKTGAITYGDATTALSAAPSQLSVQVPGAPSGFPTFTASFPPTPQQVKLTAPAQGAAITPDTVFTWSNPGGRDDTTVLLAGSQASPSVSFLCFARDDGRFTFPDSVKTALKQQGFTGGDLTSTGHFAFKNELQGDAVLATTFFDLNVLPGAAGSVQSLSVRLDQTRALFERAVREKLGLRLP